MSIRYYKLFDLLNRRGLKKSDLRGIISSATIAKLSKGAYISGEAIEKICLFLGCQPGDIMEVVQEDIVNENELLTMKDSIIETVDGNNLYPDTETEFIKEKIPCNMSLHKADELGKTERELLFKA